MASQMTSFLFKLTEPSRLSPSWQPSSQSTKKTEAFGRKFPPAPTCLAIHLALWVTHWTFSPSCADVHIPGKGQPSTCALHSLPSHILKDTRPRHLPSAIFSTGSLPSRNTVFSRLHFPCYQLLYCLVSWKSCLYSLSPGPLLLFFNLLSSGISSSIILKQLQLSTSTNSVMLNQWSILSPYFTWSINNILHLAQLVTLSLNQLLLGNSALFLLPAYSFLPGPCSPLWPLHGVLCVGATPSTACGLVLIHRLMS